MNTNSFINLTADDVQSRGAGASGADFLQASPVRIDPQGDGREDAINLFKALFMPDEYVFAAWHFKMPAIFGRTVRPRSEWETLFRTQARLPTIFLPNPVFPVPAEIKNRRGFTLRGSNSIAKFRTTVFELEGLPLKDQFEFWWAWGADKLTALLSTGWDSLQAFLRVDLPDLTIWNEIVGRDLSDHLLPWGYNERCARPTFLARVGGAGRALISRHDCKKLPLTERPPLNKQSLWFVQPELAS